MYLNNIRVYITEACNARCVNCFNRENRNNQFMDIEHFSRLCKYLHENGCRQIKIMGGEPTIHPLFMDFMKIAQDCFECVSLFTNAISDSLFDFSPRQSDIITYNFKFSRILNEKRLLLDYPGIRNLEIQITPTTKIDKIIDEIIRVTRLATDRIRPCLTLDCTSDIFFHKKAIIPIYETVWQTGINNGFLMGQDHLIPICFLAGSKIPMLQKGSNCSIDCAGLIDSNYNLRFCNQYSEILIPIFKDDDSIISIEEFDEALGNKYKRLSDVIKKKGCSKCSFYGIYCNGGCFGAKEIIEKITPLM